MKRRLFLTALLGTLLITGFTPTAGPKTEYVYICNGRYSKVYHKSKDCRGLSHCSTRIDRVTLDAALKLGRRPCKIEYR